VTGVIAIKKLTNILYTAVAVYISHLYSNAKLYIRKLLLTTLAALFLNRKGVAASQGIRMMNYRDLP